MSSNANHFLKKTLGEDFFESLQKFEIWKPGTKTVLDHEEIKTALHIVPRTVLTILVRELTPMEIGETKEIPIPTSGAQAFMKVTKHERDVYSGEIIQDNKKLSEFKYRSIPGVGLIIMSAFEMYNTEELEVVGTPEVPHDAEKKIQSIIEERIALHDLVNKVVDKRLMEKEAVQQIMLAKLTESLTHKQTAKNPSDESYTEDFSARVNDKLNKSIKKGSPLKGFLENRKKPKEFAVHMAKGENVNCPDCKKNIFDGKLFSGCICLGDDMEKKVFIKKTEEGIKVRFSKGWDQENIEMLLEVLRKRNG